MIIIFLNTKLKNFKCFNNFISGLYVYQLSYLHYSTLAILIVFSVGILVSFITYDLGIIKKQNLNKKYYFRYFRKAESEENPMKINVRNFQIY